MAKRTKTDPYSLRHIHQRAAEHADQTEFTALLEGNAVVDAGLFDDRVSGALDDFDPLDNTIQADWHRQDLENDTAVGSINEEILRRIDIMGEAYPFALDLGQLKHKPSSNHIYEFCLAICNAPNITTNPYTALPRVFERLSAHIIQLYLGRHTECIHMGSPRDAEVGINFQDAMLKLHEASGEWVWDPRSGLPDNPGTGDGGVDFVAWKRALDGRSVQLFLLGQCACGNDWDTKFDDLNLNKLKKWFHPPCIVEPVRAFVVPRHLTDENLKLAGDEAGLVFDRARLVLVAGADNDSEVITGWRSKLDELVNLVTTSA